MSSKPKYWNKAKRTLSKKDKNVSLDSILKLDNSLKTLTTKLNELQADQNSKSKEVGINSNIIRYPDNVSEKEVLKKIIELNEDSKVSGILVQLPLPNHMNEQTILDSIDPSKDADGFHPLNVGKLSISQKNDEKLLIPCTPCLLYTSDAADE